MLACSKAAMPQPAINRDVFMEILPLSWSVKWKSNSKIKGAQRGFDVV